MEDAVVVSPYDTAASSGTRFLMELTAWVAGPWAFVELTENGWLAIPALLVLVALPAVFNTPGDKQQTGIATPGRLRILIELALFGVAVVSAWAVWPIWLAVIVTAVAAAAVVTGLPRYRWLAAGAPT